jgi:hypothetical protein
MTARWLRSFVMVCACVLAACGSNSTAPSPTSSLVFTFTPNPVPTSGIRICNGVAGKSWFWTINIRNTGTATFTAASFTNTYVIPGVAAPVIAQGTANDFAGLYGSTTIAPNASVQATVCNSLIDPPTGTITISSVLRGQAGESFTTPTLQLLP